MLHPRTERHEYRLRNVGYEAIFICDIALLDLIYCSCCASAAVLHLICALLLGEFRRPGQKQGHTQE